MKRRYIAICLAALMLITLCGCTEKKVVETPMSTTPVPTTTVAPSTLPPATTVPPTTTPPPTTTAPPTTTPAPTYEPTNVEVRGVTVDKEVYKVGEEIFIHFELYNDGREGKWTAEYRLTEPADYGTYSCNYSLTWPKIEHGLTTTHGVGFTKGMDLSGKYIFEIGEHEVTFYVTSSGELEAFYDFELQRFSKISIYTPRHRYIFYRVTIRVKNDSADFAVSTNPHYWLLKISGVSYEHHVSTYSKSIDWIDASIGKRGDLTFEIVFEVPDKYDESEAELIYDRDEPLMVRDDDLL